MKKRLEGLLQRALEDAAKGGGLKTQGLPPLLFEIPKDPKFGDLACTVALGLARAERKAPRAIAETIKQHFDRLDGREDVADVEIEGPGYLNFRFKRPFWRACLVDVERPDYARPGVGQGRKVLLEFVSTNPTGPLHVGHGRGAVIGDALARLLAATGHDVVREYYVNDTGKQIDTLGRSMFARLLQAFGKEVSIPEDGYPGEYLLELAVEHRDELASAVAWAAGAAVPAASEMTAFLQAQETCGVAVCGELAAKWLLEVIIGDLEGLRVRFDEFVSEKAIRAAGVVDTALSALREKELLFEADDALWFRSSQFGDEKDRVVQRGNGELTYFASDIGYHDQKCRRGYDRLIDVWGADHHGYIPRVKAALQALGNDPEKLHVVLVQIVRLTRGGEPVRMGKRSGEFVTMREVVEEVGPDAARFFFLMRRADSHLDFDLDLAKKQTAENPVFYVQYAHARICSLFRQAREAGVAVPDAAAAEIERLVEPEEEELIRLLARFPDVVEEAARELEPHRVVFQLIDLAGAFHRCYNRHRILGSEAALAGARLYLAQAVRRVLGIGLELLGVSAPETM